MQETHRETTNNRPKVRNVTLAVDCPHLKNGSAIFVETGSIIESRSVANDRNFEIFELELKGMTVASIYQPPVGTLRIHTVSLQWPVVKLVFAFIVPLCIF